MKLASKAQSYFFESLNLHEQTQDYNQGLLVHSRCGVEGVANIAAISAGTVANALAALEEAPEAAVRGSFKYSDFSLLSRKTQA